MPSTEHDAPLFTGIDWSGRSNGVLDTRPRTLGLVAALALLATAFTYDYVYALPTFIGTWRFSRMDWLFFLAGILLVRYGLVPLVTDRDRAAPQIRAFLSRPAAVLSLTWIAGFGALAVLGPEFIGMPRVDFYIDHQPPAFTSVNVDGVYPYDCVGQMSDDVCHGTWEYPLGTTGHGEDMVNVIMYGAHISLKLAVTAATIMLVIATAVGTTAGYFGGWVDDVLMRYVDVQQTIPAIVVYIIVSTMYLDQGLFTLALIFGLLNWGGIARLIRSETLERRESGYVRAARSAGASDFHVIRRHIIPNSMATVVTAFTRQIPLLILIQVALAYLQLNVVQLRSLGDIFRRSLPPFGLGWWVAAVASVFLVVTVLAFNVFGDEIRDILDPKEVA